jgi:hypothetical protein
MTLYFAQVCNGGEADLGVARRLLDELLKKKNHLVGEHRPIRPVCGRNVNASAFEKPSFSWCKFPILSLPLFMHPQRQGDIPDVKACL